MSTQQPELHDDPVLRSALKRLYGHPKAPQSLRLRIARMAGDDAANPHAHAHSAHAAQLAGDQPEVAELPPEDPDGGEPAEVAGATEPA